MNILHQRFSFLHVIVILDTDEDDFIQERIECTCADYTELDAAAMFGEISRLRQHIKISKELNQEENVESWTAADLLQWIYKWKLQESVENLVLVLRIFLTITVSTASCERSFSKLKLIKTHQISTMGQERLSNLAILSIERDFKVNFEDVIKEFSLIKTRIF